MNENLDALKPANSLKSEHLIKGVKPIMACVGSYDDYGFRDYRFLSLKKNPIKKQFYEQAHDVQNVNYNGYPAGWDKNNFLHNGLETWIISTVDDSNKFSEELCDCTSLIVAGIDKTGKNISFLSHQDPKRFLLKENKDIFFNHLQRRFTEIKERCQDGTIDAVIVGGQLGVIEDPDPASKELDVSAKDIVGELLPPRVLAGVDKTITIQNYLNSIALLSRQVQKTFGFEPVVINGPKIVDHYDNIYYDNQNRRLYFMRPKVNSSTGSFTQADIEKEKKRWE